MFSFFSFFVMKLSSIKCYTGNCTLRYSSVCVSKDIFRYLNTVFSFWKKIFCKIFSGKNFFFWEKFFFLEKIFTILIRLRISMSHLQSSVTTLPRQLNVPACLILMSPVRHSHLWLSLFIDNHTLSSYN